MKIDGVEAMEGNMLVNFGFTSFTCERAVMVVTYLS
jgi:hypothetical protein